MTASGRPAPRLVDPAVLEQLRSELDDDDGWLQFLTNFLGHLPRRIAKLRAGLETEDYELSMDAVLSLKISCQMVGAERLADLAVRLQQSLSAFSGSDLSLAKRSELGRLFEDVTACARLSAVVLGTMIALAT
jgi:HPt (histidine-containing phosphotransfer) domain-containing protein